jgi:hypothetical protein
MAQDNQAYDTYAQQKLARILLDLKQTKAGYDWSSMADKITLHRGVNFQRINFYRLLEGKLSNPNIEIIVQWLEATEDCDIRDKLHPSGIFGEFGTKARDYYFHALDPNNFEAWQDAMLEEFSGVYLCAPARDKNSYLPMPTVRRFFDKEDPFTLDQNSRSLDIKQYISERSILILQRTKKNFFHAAEFPMGMLFPKDFVTLDIKMVYEGVGIASANSLNITLRECLTRVPKTHAILISPKAAHHRRQPFGFSLYLETGMEKVMEEWQGLPEKELQHFYGEYQHSMNADYYMNGPAQIHVSPLPLLHNTVGTIFSRDMVYHQKPADFLSKPDMHFIRPDLENTAEIKRIINSPLTVGELI